MLKLEAKVEQNADRVFCVDKDKEEVREGFCFAKDSQTGIECVYVIDTHEIIDVDSTDVWASEGEAAMALARALIAKHTPPTP